MRNPDTGRRPHQLDSGPNRLMSFSLSVGLQGRSASRGSPQAPFASSSSTAASKPSSRATSLAVRPLLSWMCVQAPCSRRSRKASRQAGRRVKNQWPSAKWCSAVQPLPFWASTGAPAANKRRTTDGLQIHTAACKAVEPLTFRDAGSARARRRASTPKEN